jgi:hypothetical protein
MKNAAFYSDVSQPLMNPPHMREFFANIVIKRLSVQTTITNFFYWPIRAQQTAYL